MVSSNNPTGSYAIHASFFFLLYGIKEMKHLFYTFLSAAVLLYFVGNLVLNANNPQGISVSYFAFNLLAIVANSYCAARFLNAYLTKK